MPWTKKDYPPSMKNLPREVKEKAIDIANTLLEEKNMDEGIAIATAISRAKDWAANRGKPTRSRNPNSRTTDVKKHGQDRYVVPRDDGWAVKVEGSKKAEKVFDSKTKAVKRGSEEAKSANASLTVQKKTGKVEKRVSYNPNKRARKVKS